MPSASSTAPSPTARANRLNDACTDSKGRLWFGSMDDSEGKATGHLFRCAGGLCADTGVVPVAITNGPALNAEATILYHTDTMGRTIYRIPVHDDGSLGKAEPFVWIEEGRRLSPTARWSMPRAACGPRSTTAGACGAMTSRASSSRPSAFPTANVTKMCFGGPDLRTAYATTARKDLDAAALASQPDAGNLFALRPPASRASR